MAEQLPSVDALLGAAPPLPGVDDILGPPPPSQESIFSGPGWDAYTQRAPLGRVLDAFGHGVKTAWGTTALGLSPDTEEALQKAGILPDVQKGQGGIVRAFNEALIRPAAAGLDAIFRAGSALFGGGQAAVAQAGAEVGAPLLGRDLAAMPEAFFGSPGGLGMPALPEAADLKVIGAGEGGWLGTASMPVKQSEAAVADMVREQQQAAANTDLPGTVPATYAPGALGSDVAAPVQPYEATLPPEPPPADVHEAARRIAPETFQEYDALAQERDGLRDVIASKVEDLQQKAEAQAPHAAEVADLQQRLQDTTPRLAKKYEARLAEIMPAHDAFLADEFTMGALTRDTPEIATLRQQLQQADYRMRDLAPDVTAAYGEAAKMFPEAEAAPGLPQETAPAQAVPQAAEPAAQEPVEAVPAQPAPTAAPPSEPPAPVAASTEPSPARLNIADDVTGKLVAAGRPQDEAQAAAQIVAAHYEARAARFEGAKGTAEDLYRAEAPDIRAGTVGGRAGAAAGKAFIKGGRTIVTLFQKADASTFLHETGHQWLEELLRDAADVQAPASLKADAGTVRKWLGAEPDAAITRRQHERFARGFEQYMMEGRAPSRGLAEVFAKFQAWLTDIYQSMSKLGKPISDDIRDVFDRLLTANPEREPAITSGVDETNYPGAVPESAIRAPASPYERLPKEPKRLIRFLTESQQSGVGIHAKTLPGGLRDEGGDVAAIVGGPKGRPGLINNKSGQSLDDATLRAHQAGYFPEHAERPEINHLLEAIRQDHEGTPRYSMHDQEAAQQFQRAMAHNAEIDRLASEHGIDTKGLTREQFFDKVTEKLSAEQVRAEIGAQEDAHEVEANEVEAEMRDFERQPWDADPFHDNGEPRTLEDMDNAYRQEATAAPAGADAEGRGDGYPPGPAGEGQEGGGSRGRGAGPAGRSGTPAGPSGVGTAAAGRSAEPVTATERFPASADGLIDKAGNIRLDLLNAPQDVQQVIRETAEANNDFIDARRGAIPDAQVLELADALGMDARTLNSRKIGQAFNAEEVTAARKLLVDSATFTRERMAAAAGGSDADVLAYAEAKARHQMIQQQVAGITAEAGRALRAFREMGGEVKEAEVLGDFLTQATGRTLYQLRQEAQLGLQLDTPQQLSKFLNDARKPNFSDMLLEYWINGLISGPATHVTYSVSNALLALWKAVPETAASAAVGTVRQAITGAENRVRWGEVGAQLYGLTKGLREGVVAAGRAARTGETTRLPGEPVAQFALQNFRGSIPGKLGDVVRLPSRGVATIHSFFRAIGYSQAKAALAYRAAAKEGLDADAFAQRVAELSTNPTPEIMEAARDEATGQTLMGRGGEFTQALARFSEKRLLGVPVLKFVMPFVKIGSNILSEGLLERSPVGMLDPDIRANVLGRNGPVARDQQIARMAVGTTVAAAVAGLAAEGYITGGGPTDPKEAALWRMTGKQPYSVRIGETWYGIHRLGPLAMLTGVAADIYELGHAMGTETADKVAALAVTSASRSLLDESWMRGPAELIEALQDPERYGAKWARDEISSFVPFSVGMSQVARAADPYSRQARTLLDAIRAKVPGLSETLLPRIDIWGQPVPNKSALGISGLSAIYETQVNHDPVNAALLRLHVLPSAPERKIRGVQLSDQQYDEFARTAGRMAKMRLDVLVGSPGFSALPDGVQAQTIRQTISNARETARTLVMLHNPGIIQQAVDAKRALVGR